MHDPFPFSSPSWLQAAVQPLADRYSLKTLPIHIHEVLIAVAIYHLTNVAISPYLSRRFFPKAYKSFNRRTRINWDVHVVSLVQSTLINTLALWVSFADTERSEMNWRGRVWGYTPACGLIQAFACGYFVWDLWISARYVSIFGPGMLAHGISALLVFICGFRPFVNYYGPTFILYELSSPFLNIHWFCDKLNLTGSKIQLYNGMLLIGTFFSCRLVWGSYNSVRVFYDVYRAMRQQPSVLKPSEGGTGAPSDIMEFAGDETVPFWLAASYLAANVTLNGLNFFWFGKMIETVRKRFDPPLGTRAVPPEEKVPIEERILVEGIDVETDTADGELDSGEETETQISRGIYGDGRTTVEVEKTEVRKRKA